MMPLILTILVFITIVLVVLFFGAAVVMPSSTLGARLYGAWPTRARFRGSIAIGYYFWLRLLLAVLGLAGVIVFSGNPFLLAGVPAFGFFIPRFILKRIVRDRQQRISAGLPCALDLTVICIETGLPLDESMASVSEELRQIFPPLSDELYLVHRDLCAGSSFDDALRNLSERTGNADIGALARALTQAGPLEVVEVLRSYARSLRRQRRAQVVLLALVVGVLAMIVGAAIIGRLLILLSSLKN